MTVERPIGIARPDQRTVIADTLSRAFEPDPVFRWLLRDDTTRRARLRVLFGLMFDIDLRFATILASPAGTATSFWRPPGRAVTPTAEIVRRALPLAGVFGLGLGRMLAVTRAIEAHLPSRGPYWYVHFVGVRPDEQGGGWGGAMMRVGLERAKIEGLPVYLETARPENVVFYRNLGFAVTDEWDVREGPRFWSLTWTPAG